MSITWTDSLDHVDWDEVAELFRVAPLGERDPSDLKLAFTNSMFRRFALEDGKPVAAGRVLADGTDCAYLCDVVVRPSHQGRGIGKQLIESLVTRSRSHKKIILYAVPGKESIYEKFGFRRMATAMAIFEDPRGAECRGYLAREVE